MLCQDPEKRARQAHWEPGRGGRSAVDWACRSVSPPHGGARLREGKRQLLLMLGRGCTLEKLSAPVVFREKAASFSKKPSSVPGRSSLVKWSSKAIASMCRGELAQGMMGQEVQQLNIKVSRGAPLEGSDVISLPCRIKFLLPA